MELILPNLKLLEPEELHLNRSRLWDGITLIDREIERRNALKHVWPQEELMILQYRDMADYTPPETWVEPKNLLHGYIAGDEVVHAHKRYRAVGPGAVLHPPTDKDPTRPDCWVYSDVV